MLDGPFGGAEQPWPVGAAVCADLAVVGGSGVGAGAQGAGARSRVQACGAAAAGMSATPGTHAPMGVPVAGGGWEMQCITPNSRGRKHLQKQPNSKRDGAHQCREFLCRQAVRQEVEKRREQRGKKDLCKFAGRKGNLGAPHLSVGGMSSRQAVSSWVHARADKGWQQPSPLCTTQHGPALLAPPRAPTTRCTASQASLKACQPANFGSAESRTGQ